MVVTSDLYKIEAECCGCEACASICPQKIIEMQPASDGFVYPVAIKPDKCISCMLCLKVCPLKHDYLGSKAEKHYGGHNLNENEIKKSASGAFATTLASSFIKNGGIVYGVRYSENFLAPIFSRCTKVSELDALRGSKYSQARKYDIFHHIKSDLKIGKSVLFIGLPCETYSLKLFLKQEYVNLYTSSLICHGPTSPAVQEKYVEEILSKISNNKIVQFTLRDKPKGWKPYYIKAIFEDGSNFSEEFHPSAYGIAFKELKRPSCAVCKFKLTYKESHIDSDLIIGDFHGATPSDLQFDKWGTSQVSVLTEKGGELIRRILEDGEFDLSEISAYKAIHYNKAINKIIRPRWNRSQFAKCFESQGLVAASKLKSILLIDAYCRTKKTIMSQLAKLKKRILS